MENALSVEKALYDMFLDRYSAKLDMLVMNKLMYLCQRESIILTASKLFDEDFLAYRYGPILKSVITEYETKDEAYEGDFGDVSPYADEVLSDVLDRYGKTALNDRFRLSRILNSDFAWKSARKGVPADRDSENVISFPSMVTSATAEKSRRIGTSGTMQEEAD